MFKTILLTFLALNLGIITLHTVIRVIRHFHKFPIPQFLANLIDNPLRRRIQPPDEMALRHGIQAGMTVLEVGPGNGRYTLATARRVGAAGKVVAVDIEPKMIERVRRRAQAEGVTNVEAKVASVYDLPFEGAYFDAIYMLSVIGEIPDLRRAIGEFQRVLGPGGTLAFSELLLDPDYPRSRTLVRLTEGAGFRLLNKSGNCLSYTVIFEKI